MHWRLHTLDSCRSGTQNPRQRSHAPAAALFGEQFLARALLAGIADRLTDRIAPETVGVPAVRDVVKAGPLEPKAVLIRDAQNSRSPVAIAGMVIRACGSIKKKIQ